jgi:hypothetical protein
MAYLKLIFPCESIEGPHDLIQSYIIDQDGVRLALEAYATTKQP